jgi:hypothetical protein
MEAIDISDLPEPVAQTVASLVESLRQLLATHEGGGKKERVPELPRWEGRVIGSLSRKELYDDN